MATYRNGLRVWDQDSGLSRGASTAHVAAMTRTFAPSGENLLPRRIRESGSEYRGMLPALALSVALATSAPAPPLDAVRRRYAALWVDITRPRIIDAALRETLVKRILSATRELDALERAPDDAALADLEREADLDERTVPALLAGAPPPLDPTPGAHVGLASVGDRYEPFAYWVPRGYAALPPAPLVVLLHGATQAENDFVARSFFRELADASGAVLLAPGGDDRDAEEMARSTDAAERALAKAVPTDPRKRYVGGYSNGVYCAFHAIATQHEAYAGMLAISGVVRVADVRAVGLRLAFEGAYVIEGGGDRVIGVAAVRSVVRRLRAQRVYARYYEDPRATHELRSLYGTIARGWDDMFAGVTTIPDDGLGQVTDTAV